MLKVIGSITLLMGLVTLISLIVLSNATVFTSVHTYAPYGSRFLLRVFKYGSKILCVVDVGNIKCKDIEGFEYHMSVYLHSSYIFIKANRTVQRIWVKIEKAHLYVLDLNDYKVVGNMLAFLGNSEEDAKKLLSVLEEKKIVKKEFVRKDYKTYAVEDIRIGAKSIAAIATVILPEKYAKYFISTSPSPQVPRVSPPLTVFIRGMYARIIVKAVIKPNTGQLLRALDVVAIGSVILLVDAYRNPSDYKKIARATGRIASFFKSKK